MTTNQLDTATIDDMLSQHGMIPGSDFVTNPVAGAPHAVSIMIRLTGLTAKIRRHLRTNELLLEPTFRLLDGQELVVASLPQPDGDAGL